MRPIAHSLAALVVAPVAVLTATSEPPPPTSTDESPGLTEMVAIVPATSFEPGSDAQLYYVDMSLAWERLGVGTDPTDREERVGQFARVENYTLMPQLFFRQPLDFDAARTEIGFSVVEIDRELAVLSPPDNLVIDATNVPVNEVEAVAPGVVRTPAAAPMFDPAFLLLTEAELEQILASSVFPEPYLGVAIAEVDTADRIITNILLVHPDAESAASNADAVTEALATNVDQRTRRPLVELLPGAEVAVEGPIVRVTVPAPGAFRIAFDLLQICSLFPAR